MFTCKRCGHQTKTKNIATKNASSCTHERTTSTASSSKNCRLCCLESHTYVAEEKREEKKKTNPGMKPSKDSVAFDNRPNPALTSSQMLLVASTFKGMIRNHAREVSTTDTITHRELEKLLEDPVDINMNPVQPAQPAGPAASSWRTAVSSSSYRNSEPVTTVAVPAPRTEAPAANAVPVFRNTAMMHAASSSHHLHYPALGLLCILFINLRKSQSVSI